MRYATMNFWEEARHQTLGRDPGNGSKGLAGNRTQGQYRLGLSALGPGTSCSSPSASLF